MANFYQFVTNRKFILPLLAVNVFFGLYLFPSQFKRIEGISGKVFVPLDKRISYSLDDVNTLLEEIQPEGRAVYRSFLLRVDAIFPLLYGTLLALLIFNFLDRLNFSHWFHLLALLPVLAVVFDYFENCNTLGLLASFPNLTEGKVAWGEQMSRWKWGLVFLSLGTALTLYLLQFTQRYRKQNNNSKS